MFAWPRCNRQPSPRDWQDDRLLRRLGSPGAGIGTRPVLATCLALKNFHRRKNWLEYERIASGETSFHLVQVAKNTLVKHVA